MELAKQYCVDGCRLADKALAASTLHLGLPSDKVHDSVLVREKKRAITTNALERMDEAREQCFKMCVKQCEPVPVEPQSFQGYSRHKCSTDCAYGCKGYIAALKNAF